MRDKEVWTEIKGAYKAKGHETVFLLNVNSRRFNYYYIDDVSITPINDTCD
ncbi:MAG: hypothetical protein HRT71_14690 [Flavobacteriales bacterium]|nr:hypothetical protein [Flavobacteriales bacterium]